jgi:hypothetical protein
MVWLKRGKNLFLYMYQGKAVQKRRAAGNAGTDSAE